MTSRRVLTCENASRRITQNVTSGNYKHTCITIGESGYIEFPASFFYTPPKTTSTPTRLYRSIAQHAINSSQSRRTQRGPPGEPRRASRCGYWWRSWNRVPLYLLDCWTTTNFPCSYEVSRALALAGVKVIMVNRKEEQGSEAISSIKKEKADADVEWKHCDMGSLKEVKEVFSGLRNSLERLDFLVLSAGINTLVTFT